MVNDVDELLTGKIISFGEVENRETTENRGEIQAGEKKYYFYTFGLDKQMQVGSLVNFYCLSTGCAYSLTLILTV